MKQTNKQKNQNETQVGGQSILFIETFRKGGLNEFIERKKKN